MASKDIFKRSVVYHRKLKGKLEVIPKIKVRDKADLSLAYTPGVGEVCRVIAKDAAQAYELTIKRDTIAVVSDGSAILGLGNLGPEAALPVMEGKALLFKEFGGVNAFPICLATQDTEEIIETVKRIAPVFGGINLEDISAPRCFEIERRLKEELSIPVMHDDQHGTAVVVLAALINALKLRKISPAKLRVVINGAGAAGTAVSEILLAYGVRDVVVLDRQGILCLGRCGQKLDAAKEALARKTNPRNIEGGLPEALLGANVFIGVSAAGALRSEWIGFMAERPIILALANPVPEIMPEEARHAGAFIVATGRSDFPNQINNLLAFPGLFRGALKKRIRQFDDGVFVRAAKNLALCVKRPTKNRILPGVFDKGIVEAVARAVR